MKDIDPTGWVDAAKCHLRQGRLKHGLPADMTHKDFLAFIDGVQEGIAKITQETASCTMEPLQESTQSPQSSS